MKDLDFPNLRLALKKAGPYLRAADEVLGAIHRAREGGLFSKILATTAAAGTLATLFAPARTARDELVARGFRRVPTGIGRFVCKLLADSSLPMTSEEVGEHVRVVHWPGDVVAIYQEDAYADGPFVKEGKLEELARAIEASVWAGKKDLMLVLPRARGGVLTRARWSTTDDDGEGGSEFELVPMPPPGVWIGEPGLEWFVKRLERHGNETRSMLLTGPTGVGKSTLGRLIAQSISAGRLLKISANALRRTSSADVLDLVELLRPSVLLLDDLARLEDSNHGAREDEQMLELFEALHGKARLVIATLMVDPTSQRGQMQEPSFAYGRRRRRYAFADETGGLDYFSGMRPGRIDEVVRVKMPSPHVRAKILEHYLGNHAGLTDRVWNELVAKTEGLTGAYLREVAWRLKVHGTATWKSEVQSVRSASPHAPRRLVRVAIPRRMSSAKAARALARLEASLKEAKTKLEKAPKIVRRGRRHRK